MLVPMKVDYGVRTLVYLAQQDEEGFTPTSNIARAQHIPEPYLKLWTEDEREWASRLYQSLGFQSVRERFVEISRALDTTRPGPERSRLVEEMQKLER